MPLACRSVDRESMCLRTRCICAWPKLAWVAQFEQGSKTIDVLHGPRVETRSEWIAEAVWDGPFEEGNFDRTDLVFGTGVRVRDNKVVFVASGTTTDRLWYCQRAARWYVSNSLPALLATADLCLREEHHYFTDLRTICGGLGEYARIIPALPTDVHVQYFHDLQYDSRQLCEREKPDTVPSLTCFGEYDELLTSAAERIAQNMNDSARRHLVSPLTSISSGYDASVAAVIARRAGCQQAVTLRQSTSFWRGSDSGQQIAQYLGLSCRVYDRTAQRYPHEASVWCTSGRAALLNWTQFEYPEPLCLFFSGCRGDRVWDRSDQEPPDPFSVPSVSDLSFCEFRLIRGVFHCVIPFWGIRHIREIRAIARLPEMDPWTVGGRYDRPVARRIIEEAGVPRGCFAVRKKNSAIDSYFLWPTSPDARRDFQEFLQERGLFVPPAWLLPVLRGVVNFDRLAYLNINSRFGLWDPALRIRLRLKANGLLFHWSNHCMKQVYRKNLMSGMTLPEENAEHESALPLGKGDR
ncbi:MAG: hypothetical protein ACYC4B_24835 [Pirellulaceae bacterium]